MARKIILPELTSSLLTSVVVVVVAMPPVSASVGEYARLC